MTVPVCTILTETSPQALPLGAACIVSAINAHFAKLASSFPQAKEVKAQLAVFSAEENPSAEFIATELLKTKPVALCFSVFVWNYHLLTQVAQIIHKKAPELFLIAGGPEITANPETCPDFDYLVSGEGEEQVPKLLEKLLLTSEKPQDRHIHGSRVSPEKLVSPYLDGTLDPKNYAGGALWELARGCPFKCAYCYESKGEKTVVHFPLERIKKELDFFKQKNVTQVFVLDPTYNANKQRALELLQYIKKTAPNIFFHFECRAEFLDKSLAKAFASVSCSLQIGLQSANPQVLKLVNRNFNRQEFIKKINILNNSGVIFGFDLIYGLPGDTLQGFKESIDFALSLYPNSLEIFRLSVLPGTTLYDKRKELELTAQQTPPYLIQKTAKFSSEDLEKAEQLGKATALFYSQGRAVSWFLTLLKPLKQKPCTFFQEFAEFIETTKNAKSLTLNFTNSGCIEHEAIEKLQIDFIKLQYQKRKIAYLLPAALDLIRMNGAFSRAYADGKTTTLQLSYHPEDILSPYAQDISFFAKNAAKHTCSVKVFADKGDPLWKLCSKG